jgi:Family of unknown function (DUF6165)
MVGIMAIQVPVSWGEVIDKITILEIKNERLVDAAKLLNVRKELGLLVAIRDREFANHPALQELSARLKDINLVLWDVEDYIRDCERAKDFGPKFIELARAVYVHNDERAQLKRQINQVLGSDLVEEKSYAPYKS